MSGWFDLLNISNDMKTVNVRVDLFSLVSSESVGPRHISGTGGHLETVQPEVNPGFRI